MCALMDALKHKIAKKTATTVTGTERTLNSLKGQNGLNGFNDQLGRIPFISNKIKNENNGFSVWDAILFPGFTKQKKTEIPLPSSPVRANFSNLKKNLFGEHSSETTDENEIKNENEMAYEKKRVAKNGDIKNDFKKDTKNVSNGGRDDDYGDTEGEDDDEDDEEDEGVRGGEKEDEMITTWRSTKSGEKKNTKKTVKSDKNSSDKNKIKGTVFLPTLDFALENMEKLTNVCLSPLGGKNRKTGSPYKSPRFREFPGIIGSAYKNCKDDLRNKSDDITSNVSAVYYEIKENVHTVAIDLEKEGNELKVNDISDNETSLNDGEREILDLTMIKLFIGISGPYNLQSLTAHMQSRGLDHSILKWICKGDIRKYSPVLLLRDLMTISALTHTPDANLSKGNETSAEKIKNGKNEYQDGLQILTNTKNLFLKIPELFTGTTAEDFSPPKNTDSSSNPYGSPSFSTFSPMTHAHQDLLIPTANQIHGLESQVHGLDCQGPESQATGPGGKTLSQWGFPPVALFHGAEDISVPSSVSVEMAAALCRWGGEVRHCCCHCHCYYH